MEREQEVVGGRSFCQVVVYMVLTGAWQAWVPQTYPEDIRLELGNRVRGLWSRTRQEERPVREEYISVTDTPPRSPAPA